MKAEEVKKLSIISVGLCLVTVLILQLLAIQPAQARISQKDYHEILDSIETLFAADFEKANQRLIIHRNWKNDSSKASAWKQEDIKGQLSEIRMPGGIARHPLITNDSFALIACHEIGHHLAGGPKVWLYSVEGQADYYSVSVCMKKLLPAVKLAMKGLRGFAPDEVLSSCGSAHENYADTRVCIRSMLAGLELAQYFALEKSEPLPRLDLRENTVAAATIMVAPNPQCRLDTYVQAALCANHDNWLCTDEGSKHGRPACWYNPNHTEESLKALDSLLGGYPQGEN